MRAPESVVPDIGIKANRMGKVKTEIEAGRLCPLASLFIDLITWWCGCGFLISTPSYSDTKETSTWHGICLL